ncbi:putative Myosin-related [Quillaja saponaria]|uniref:Myosin-related n=1 Tax=Quillaja saponaria TaxID=32244 RepID=A0AAD7LTM4_QUISA|nr:putative Myosin-related [Quillaja saponaria]
MSTTTATRRAKWHYPPPPPTPKILHLPRRPRRRPNKTLSGKPTSSDARRDHKGKLESLFDQERTFSRNVPIVLLDYSERRRERVEGRESCELGGDGGCGLMMEEERWRFQAEILRAECNLLRMEKEIAVKKLERTRAQMERTLRSAVQTLVSGRIKICEGQNVGIVLDEEIQVLTEKLEKLERRSGRKDLDLRTKSNFDKQASVLQRRLEKFGGTSDETCVKEIREMAEASLSIKTRCRADESFVCSGKLNVEILRRKMERLSKGILLERMEEEYKSMLSTASTSAASSASTSRRIDFPDSSSIRQPNQETVSHGGKLCSGQCKSIVRRIVEQVRAETEQWSQMQEMLGQVREEMEELQTSRDFWEARALDSDFQIQSLHTHVQEWRQKALSSETQANQLQTQLSVLCGDLERLRNEQNAEKLKERSSQHISLDVQNEMEKRVLVCHLKENIYTGEIRKKQSEVSRGGRRKAQATSGGSMATKRSPFQDIGNSSLLMRQNSKAVFPLHCHPPSNKEESF